MSEEVDLESEGHMKTYWKLLLLLLVVIGALVVAVVFFGFRIGSIFG